MTIQHISAITFVTFFLFNSFESIAQDTASCFPGYLRLDDALSAVSQPYIYDGKGAIRLGSEVSVQTNGVPYDFGKAFVFPEFIDREKKDNAYSKLKGDNRFGALTEWQAQIIFPVDSASRAKGSHLSVRYRENSAYTGKFGDDAFKLLFDGNKQFAGQTADISGTELYFLAYRSFELGYVLTKPKALYSIHFGLATGRNFQQLKIEKGNLYTAEDGTYLDLNWNGSFFGSASRVDGFFNSRASGAIMSLEFKQLAGRKWVFTESLSDLGFMNWNPAGRVVSVDTAFRFTGIQLGNIFDLNVQTIVLGDTLEQKLLGDNVRENRMTALPFHLNICAERMFAGRWSGSVFIDYRYLPGFQPQAGLSARKGFGKQRSIRLIVSYGGFGGLQTGLDAVVFSNHHHSLNIGTIYNEAFFASKSAGSVGFRLFYVHHI